MAQCPVGVLESGGQRGESAGTTYFQDAVDSGKGISIGGISIGFLEYVFSESATNSWITQQNSDHNIHKVERLSNRFQNLQRDERIRFYKHFVSRDRMLGFL
jgi:hypothetical protein